MLTLAKFDYPSTCIYPVLIVSNQTEVSTVHKGLTFRLFTSLFENPAIPCVGTGSRSLEVC